jgi:hypothetical protein
LDCICLLAFPARSRDVYQQQHRTGDWRETAVTQEKAGCITRKNTFL